MCDDVVDALGRIVIPTRERVDCTAYRAVPCRMVEKIACGSNVSACIRKRFLFHTVGKGARDRLPGGRMCYRPGLLSLKEGSFDRSRRGRDAPICRVCLGF